MHHVQVRFFSLPKISSLLCPIPFSLSDNGILFCQLECFATTLHNEDLLRLYCEKEEREMNIG